MLIFRKKLAEDFPWAAWLRPLAESETEYSLCWSDCSFSEKAGSYSWPHRHLCEPRGESPCLKQAWQQHHHQRGHHSPALLQVWGGDGADGVGVHGGGKPGERLRLLQQVHNVRSQLCPLQLRILSELKWRAALRTPLDKEKLVLCVPAELLCSLEIFYTEHGLC